MDESVTEAVILVEDANFNKNPWSNVGLSSGVATVQLAPVHFQGWAQAKVNEELFKLKQIHFKSVFQFQ